jgi:hypothetical protein
MVAENETHFLFQFVWRRLTFCIVEKWKVWRTKGEVCSGIYVFVSTVVLICFFKPSAKRHRAQPQTPYFSLFPGNIFTFSNDEMEVCVLCCTLRPLEPPSSMLGADTLTLIVVNVFVFF